MVSAISVQHCSDDAKATASPHVIQSLPILVLFPHNRCNCRCIMCDIWRIRQVRELTTRDLEPHVNSLLALQVRWVVLSGGEPQLNREFNELGRMFRSHGIRVTMLTAGLLLKSHAAEVAQAVDDVIVSIDGPPVVHDRIRSVPKAFERLARGIAAVRELRPGFAISGRTTVQKLNHQYLCETVGTAKELGLDSISFLSADLASEAFNRAGGWSSERQASIALNAAEAQRLQEEIEALISTHQHDIETRYIAESPDKLRRIVLHFRAHLGQCRPVAPRCNAPWVSAVIEADGTVRPCFFHRSFGNIHEQSLPAILNGGEALSFRQELRVATNPICRTCVCSLNLPAV